MKKWILLLCASLAAVQLSAQAHNFFHLTAAKSFITLHHKGLNNIIDRYNETRQGQAGAFSLDREMRKISVMDGFDLALGTVNTDCGCFIDLRFAFHSANTFAEGQTADGIAGRRDLQVDLFTFQTNWGLSLIQNKHMETQAGFSIDVGSEKVSTAINDGPFEKIDKQTLVSSTLSLQSYWFLSRKIPLALFGRTFGQFHYLRADYSEVNVAINPATHQNDADLKQKSRPSNFGFELGVSLVIHERDHSFTREN